MSINNKHLIPNSFINWHFQAFKTRELDISALLKSVDLCTESLTTPGYLLDASQYARLIKSTAEYFNDEGFGGTDKPIRPGAFQLMTQACISCTTLQQVIERMFQFYSVLSDELNWGYQIKGQQVELHFDLVNKSGESASYYCPFMMSSLRRWLSWMIAKPIFVDAVEFSFAKPEYSEELRNTFISKIRYNKSQNKLIFHSHYLEQAIKQTPESLQLFLRSAPECLLSHYKNQVSIHYQVRQYLEENQNLQQVKLEQLALHFHCSVQTLMRGLRRENANFKEIKNKVLKQRAINLLLKSDNSIEEIAITLGFSEVSSFYRNFKKWTKLTPTEFRNQ